MNFDPCPFCGDNLVGINSQDVTWCGEDTEVLVFCYCFGCSARGPEIVGDPFNFRQMKDQAIEAWSKRSNGNEKERA